MLASVSFLIISIYLWKKKTKEIDDQSPATGENNKNETFLQKMTDILLGMLKTVFKKRARWMTVCLLLQIAAYTMFYISFGSGRFIYLFTRKVLGWTQDEYITLKVMRKSLGIIILIIVLPALKRLKISDVNLLIIFNGLHSLGFLIAACSSVSIVFIFLGFVLQHTSLDLKWCKDWYSIEEKCKSRI